jgi:DNA polymerase-1
VVKIPGYLVGHNFIGYDLPMLNRHWGSGICPYRVVDTFVLSQLYNPVIVGGHSLRAWGDRLKFPKDEFNDFSRLSPEMVEYCSRDTSLTARLYRRLTERMLSVGFTEDGCEIESLAWNIIQNKQRRVGFPFDERKAHELYGTIRQREASLKEEIYRRFPPRLLVVGEYAKSFKADGQPTALYQRHLEQYPRLELREDGGYRAYDYVPFNLGSPQQRIAKLLELGWTPTRRTPKGNPQVDEEELLEFSESSGIPEVALIAKWLVANSRGNMIRTWLDAVDEKTHAIHGRLFLASTLRYRHNSPNSANIPAVRQDKETKEDVVWRGLGLGLMSVEIFVYVW